MRAFNRIHILTATVDHLTVFAAFGQQTTIGTDAILVVIVAFMAITLTIVAIIRRRR